MFFDKNLFCFLTIFVVFVANVESQQPVGVDLYYETLCPDTVRFFKNQLFPAWQKLKDSGYYRSISHYISWKVFHITYNVQQLDNKLTTT